MARENVKIQSHGEKLAGWLYKGRDNAPVIVMAHGLGAVKEMRLDAYAERFSALGYWCLVFDYRFFGESSGKPRQWLDIGKQHQDWNSAIHFARTSIPKADNRRIVLFGSSFSGGHVIAVAAQDGHIAAVVSQCPFTQGISSVLRVAPLTMPRLMYRAIKDQLFSTDDTITSVPLAAEQGQLGLMNSHDALDYLKLVPEGAKFEKEVAARLALWIPFYAPGRSAKNVKCPIYFALCDKDSVAPASTAEGYAKQAPRGTFKHYDCGHFDIYLGDWFEQAVKDYTSFIQKHVPVATQSRL